MAGLKLLAVSSRSARVGAVFLIGDRLLDWRLSKQASRTPTTAEEYMMHLIATLQPDVVVTEDVSRSRKGQHTKDIMAVMTRVASASSALDLSLPPPHRQANHALSAQMLAERWPDIAAWTPKPRRIFDPEPHTVVLFEALGLAAAIIPPVPSSPPEVS